MHILAHAYIQAVRQELGRRTWVYEAKYPSLTKAERRLRSEGINLYRYAATVVRVWSGWKGMYVPPFSILLSDTAISRYLQTAQHIGTDIPLAMEELVALLLEDEYCVACAYVDAVVSNGSAGAVRLRDVVEVMKYNLTDEWLYKYADEDRDTLVAEVIEDVSSRYGVCSASVRTYTDIARMVRQAAVSVDVFMKAQYELV